MNELKLPICLMGFELREQGFGKQHRLGNDMCSLPLQDPQVTTGNNQIFTKSDKTFEV